MKKFIYIAFALVAVLLSSSCERDLTTFTYDDCAGATFRSKSVKYSMTKEDGNKIAVELYRGNTKGDAAVAFEMDDYTDGVFVPEKNAFEFKDGENVAVVNFNYPNFEDFLGETYKFTIIIDDEQTALTGIGTLAVSAQRELTLNPLGEGVFDDQVFYGESWEQPIYNTEEAASYFILPDVFSNGYDISFTVENGVFTLSGDTIDTGVEYGGDYGNYGIMNASIEYDPDGKQLIITGSFGLPDIEYEFAPYLGYFVLPEDFDVNKYFGI